MAELVLKSGDGSPRVIELTRRITTVGRDPQSDLPIDDPALPPTALHVLADGDAFTVSAHSGVELTVNGRRRTTCRLAPGDVLRAAGHELHFSPPSPAPPAAGAPPREDPLVRFSRRLLEAGSLETLLDALLDALLEVTRADKGFVIELIDGQPEVRASRNVAPGNVEEAVSRVSDSIVQKVLATRRPLVVADALHDAEWSSSASVVNLRLQSVMCAPLLARGEVFGAIYLGNDSVRNLFDERSLETLTVFASQASLLLQNALLLRDLRARERGASRGHREPALRRAGGGRPEHARGVPAHREGGADRRHRARPGRDGDGQGARGPRDPRRSPRGPGPFVAVNCAAIPEGLLESELFGHVKGAFTGAVATRAGTLPGRIGRHPLPRRDRRDAPVPPGEAPPGHPGAGGPAGRRLAPEPVDIRVVAATNRNLEDEVRAGRFREDLYYRLHVVTISLPPLRERGDDVTVLGRWFLQRYAAEFDSRARGFAPGALAALRKYHWPGNIRELENRVKKAAVLADGPLVTAEDLDLLQDSLEATLPLADAIEEFRKRYISDILERNGGNRTKTAKDLDVDPRTVFRHLEKLESERRGGPATAAKPTGGTP